MLTQIPNYARPMVQSFLESGTVTGLDFKTPLKSEEAAYWANQIKDEFNYKRALDEGPQDKLTGQLGEIRLEDEWGGHEEMSFSGNDQAGQMIHVDSTPAMHYGAEYTHVTKMADGVLENFQVGHFIHGDYILAPHLVHVDTNAGTGYIMTNFDPKGPGQN